MTEHEFLEQLSQALKNLPDSQRDDILGEYRSHFFEARERGKDDAAISEALGDPKSVARTYVADYHFEQWQAPTEGQGIGKSVSHLFRGLLVVFSLLFFNFFFMLWPILTAALMLVVAWICVGALALASLALAVVGLFGTFFGAVFGGVSAQAALFFYSFGTGLFCCLIGYALYRLSQLAVWGILRYIKLNINLASA